VTVRLRKRAAGLVMGASVLFLLGTNVQAGWLYVLSALLLGTAVAGVVLPRRMLRGLMVEREAPEEVVQGEDTFVKLIVTNASGGIRLGLRVDDPHVAPTELFVTAIRPGERVELVTSRVAARRGVHEDAPVVLRSNAPFGVAERRRRLAVSGRTIVVPAVVPLGRLPFLSRASDPERAARSVPRRGAGPEYLGVREYRPGDNPRHVHWPSTARTGSVMVRELEEERSRRLAFVVDTLTDVGEAGTPLDACCTAAASIGRVAAGDGRSVRLVTTGARGALHTADELDEGSLRRGLAALVPTGIPFADTVANIGDVLAGIDEVVLLFPTWRTNGDVALARAVEALAGGRLDVVAIPVEVGADDARRVAALRPEENDAMVGSLAAAGAQVFPWRHGVALSEALSHDPAGVA
jgi:uncharacterized protein (DUF58 family)